MVKLPERSARWSPLTRVVVARVVLPGEDAAPVLLIAELPAAV